MPICTLGDVKTRMGVAAADMRDSDIISDLIEYVGGLFDTECERHFLLPAAAVTEYHDGGKEIHLEYYPVVSTTSVKIASDWDWTGADALDSDVDYRLKAEKGVVYYTTSYGWPWEPADMQGNFPEGIDNLQIIYKGGYTEPSDAVGAGETALPFEIRYAAVDQVIYFYNQRDTIGKTSVSSEGRSMTKTNPYDLLPNVRRVLQQYRR